MGHASKVNSYDLWLEWKYQMFPSGMVPSSENSHKFSNDVKWILGTYHRSGSIDFNTYRAKYTEQLSNFSQWWMETWAI